MGKNKGAAAEPQGQAKQDKKGKQKQERQPQQRFERKEGGLTHYSSFLQVRLSWSPAARITMLNICFSFRSCRWILSIPAQQCCSSLTRSDTFSMPARAFSDCFASTG